MQVTPVAALMKLIIAKERKIIISPMIAYVRVFLASSISFGCPPDLINLTPAKIIKTTATIAAKIRAQVTTELKTTGRQFKVGTPFSTQFPQFSIN